MALPIIIKHNLSYVVNTEYDTFCKQVLKQLMREGWEIGIISRDKDVVSIEVVRTFRYQPE